MSLRPISELPIRSGTGVRNTISESASVGSRSREMPTWAKKTQLLKADVPIANIWPQVRRVPTSSGQSTIRACACDTKSAKRQPIRTLNSVMNRIGNCSLMRSSNLTSSPSKSSAGCHTNYMPKGPQGQKRPADVIGNAVHVMRIAVVSPFEI